MSEFTIGQRVSVERRVGRAMTTSIFSGVINDIVQTAKGVFYVVAYGDGLLAGTTKVRAKHMRAA